MRRLGRTAPESRRTSSEAQECDGEVKMIKKRKVAHAAMARVRRLATRAQTLVGVAVLRHETHETGVVQAERVHAGG